MAWLRKHWPVSALAAAALAMILPLWLVQSPAMPDYPARLAGFYLIAGGAKHSLFYGIDWALIPNLAGEVLVPLFARALPLETAARLFLSIAVLMWVAAPALIQRALYGRIGVLPLAAALFAYNVNFMWGFFNYYFAAGLCLLLFAGWIASARWLLGLRLALFSLATTALYFAHILSAALFLLLVVCYEAAERQPVWRRLVVRFVILALPAAVLFAFKPEEYGTGFEFDLIGTFLDRIESLLHWHFDSPAYLLLAALALLFGLGLWRKSIEIHPRMRLVLLAMAALSLFAPEVAMGGWGLHLRFPAVACALLFAASRIELSPRLAGAAGATGLAAIFSLSAALAQNWHSFDPQVKEFRSALKAAPPGLRLLTAVDGDGDTAFPKRLYWHFAEYGILDRGDFSALMFTTRGQHAVSLKPQVAPFAAHTARDGTPPDLDELYDLASGNTAKTREELRYLLRFPCHYDEVILIRASNNRAKVPPMLKLRHQGSFFALYDVARPAGCSTISATLP